MNHSRVRVFSVVALACALLPAAAAAQDRPAPALWFQGTRLVLEHPVAMNGDIALSTRDAGLRRFLARLGATVAYQPQQRYVIVTTQDRRTVVFTLGDEAYTVAGVRSRAPFAPFVDGADPVLPFFALARALYVEPVNDGAETVLQPRVGALDVRSDGPRTIVTVRAAMPLVSAGATDAPERLAVSFVGQGSALAADRRAPAPNVDAIGVEVRGSNRVPTTTVTISGARGTMHRIVPTDSPDTYEVVFEPRGGVAYAPPTPPPYDPRATAPTASPSYVPGADASPPTAAPPIVAGRATVTGVALEQGPADALNVRIALSGATNYEWHRLADHRWYLDLIGTTLNGPGRDEHPSFGTVQGVRIRQTGSTDTPSVRIAFTLAGDQRVDLSPTDTGLLITVGDAQAVDLARSGSGNTGGIPVVASAGSPQPTASDPGWKYAASGAGSKIIVIDPGHGGGDTGAAHNGLVEKDLTMNIAQRLRSLLTAQGWIVRMTRDTDIDPVSPENLAKMRADGKPNADDRAYLQTRCDIANSVNARLFVSIHINSAPVASAAGSTFYWYKPQDAAFAQALEHAVVPLAGTQDDGARHENFYVVRHTTMPAVLVETAFLTNPGDVALLRTPSFLQGVAQGIANGIKAYAGNPAMNSVSSR